MKKTIHGLIKAVKEEDASISGAIASSESVDRDGDTLVQSGWELENFQKNPVLLWSHNPFELPIGKVTSIGVEGGELLFDADFAVEENDFAEKVFNLIKGGFLNAFSVGFIPKEQKDGKITKMELLEISVVPIPANQDAMVSREYKSFLEFEKNYRPMGQKPFPNEHSCRLRQPSDFEDGSFRRDEREHEGKKYDVIMGRLKGEDTMTEQAFRYPKDAWKADEARTHCDSHDGSFEAASDEAGKSMNGMREHMGEMEEHMNGMQKSMSGMKEEMSGMMDEGKGAKTGRVLSEKNRTLMRTSIDSMRGAIVSLEDLLSSTEPEEKQGHTGEKPRKRHDPTLQALKVIDKAVEYLLQDRKSTKRGGD